jgi:hypothetical protein
VAEYNKTEVLCLKEHSRAAQAHPELVGKPLVIVAIGGMVSGNWVSSPGQRADKESLRRTYRVRADGTSEVFTVFEDDLDRFGMLDVQVKLRCDNEAEAIERTRQALEEVRHDHLKVS